MVRDWLTMTFTRSLTNLRLRQDRLRFRSVANAIRAGIVVDRYALPLSYLTLPGVFSPH